MSVLKRWLRSEFEKTAIGHAIAACPELYPAQFGTSENTVSYSADLRSSYFEHIVVAKPGQLLSSYYAIGGCRFSERSSLKLVMGPAWPDKNKLGPFTQFGTDYDYIELDFSIAASDSDHIDCTRVTKFSCNDAAPTQAGFATDLFFMEADSLVESMNQGLLIDFPRLKKMTYNKDGFGLQACSAEAFKAFDQAGLLSSEAYGSSILQRKAIPGTRGRGMMHTSRELPVHKL